MSLADMLILSSLRPQGRPYCIHTAVGSARVEFSHWRVNDDTKIHNSRCYSKYNSLVLSLVTATLIAPSDSTDHR